MPTNTTQPDPFVQLSIDTSNGLSAAIRELGWIASGGDPTATADDIAGAVEEGLRLERERTRVQQRLVAFLSKKLSINPPSPTQVRRAREIAEQLAGFAEVNVTFTAIMNAATEILNIYKQA